jgi:nucleoside-diphosphate-sugar epimerase
LGTPNDRLPNVPIPRHEALKQSGFPTSVKVGRGPQAVRALTRTGAFELAEGRNLGYEPEWTIERGLADYAEWLKTHEA